MNSNNVLVQVAALIVISGTGNVFAHDGHGQGSSHWHATDVWGFVVAGAMLAVAVWLSRGGK